MSGSGNLQSSHTIMLTACHFGQTSFFSVQENLLFYAVVLLLACQVVILIFCFLDTTKSKTNLITFNKKNIFSNLKTQKEILNKKALTKSKNIKESQQKHRENRKKLPREHLIGCQCVKRFLLKDPLKYFFVIN